VPTPTARRPDVDARYADDADDADDAVMTRIVDKENLERRRAVTTPTPTQRILSWGYKRCVYRRRKMDNVV
jgi:hypothetical protein